MSAIQDREQDQAYERRIEQGRFAAQQARCSDPTCRKIVDPAYVDLCTAHGYGRVWIRQALGRVPGDYPTPEQIRDAAALRDLRAPVIVDDTCLPSRPCLNCPRCVAVIDGMSA